MTCKRTLRWAITPLALTLILVGCATSPRRGVVVTNCISDPLTESLHCVSPLGVDFEVIWEHSGNFVCRPPADDQQLLEETRLK
jgi:hypothetical protein